MEEAFAWHNIWIALGAFWAAVMLFLKAATYLNAAASWQFKLLFVGLHVLTTTVVVLFALTDTSHGPSPLAAYVNAAGALVVVSGGVGTWGLSEMIRGRSHRHLRR